MVKIDYFPRYYCLLFLGTLLDFIERYATFPAISPFGNPLLTAYLPLLTKEEIDMKNIELGDCVVDSITSYAGTVTAINQKLGGSPQACVEAHSLQDGRPVEVWFDVHRLTLGGDES